MRDYELTYIVNPQAEEEALDAILEELKEVIESFGDVKEVEPWGLRRLAYPISGFREGQYVHVQFGMEPQGIAELQRSLKLNESIIRHLIVRADE